MTLPLRTVRPPPAGLLREGEEQGIKLEEQAGAGRGGPSSRPEELGLGHRRAQLDVAPGRPTRVCV